MKVQYKEFKTGEEVAEWYDADNIIQIIPLNPGFGVFSEENPNAYPAYPDDFYPFESKKEFPENGDKGLYFEKNTGNYYRWDGTSYVQVGSTRPMDLEEVRRKNEQSEKIEKKRQEQSLKKIKILNFVDVLVVILGIIALLTLISVILVGVIWKISGKS